MQKKKLDRKTATAIRNDLISVGEIPNVKVTDSLGRVQPRQRKPITVFNPTPQEAKALLIPAVIDKVVSGEAKSLSAAMIQVRRENIPTVAPKMPSGKFEVIYADPPYRYKQGTVDVSREIENQYPTMTLEDIYML
ncbi:MAG: hypothetical protein LBH79_03090 [Nitrososphaerota archaeon]|nr:hypothetical protein [Nitrososphaerota archaeon]